MLRCLPRFAVEHFLCRGGRNSRQIAALQKRCDALLEEGLFAETIAILEQLIALTRDPRAYAKLGVSYLRLQQF